MVPYSASGAGPARAAARMAASPDRPGHGTDRRVVDGIPGAHVRVAARNAALGRLEAVDAVQAGGDSDAAAPVAALRHRGEAGSHRGARTAAGPSGSPLGVPGISAGTVDQILGGAGEAEFGGVGLADDDPAGVLHPLHAEGVAGGDLIGRNRAVGEADALDALQILDGHGNSVQRSQRLARQDRRLRLPRLFQRQIVGDGDEGSQPGIVTVDPLQRGLHQLHRRQLPGRDKFAEPIEGLIRQFMVHSHRFFPYPHSRRWNCRRPRRVQTGGVIIPWPRRRPRRWSGP